MLFWEILDDISNNYYFITVWTSDEVAEWLRRWTANPLGSALVFRFYGVMVSNLDSESSDPGSNLGGTFSFY